MSRTRSRLIGLATAGAAAAALFASIAPVDAQTAPSDTMTVQILGLNDFHGNIEPPAGSSGRIGTTNAGGAEYLATHLRRLRDQNSRTLIVHADDCAIAKKLKHNSFSQMN